MNVPIASNIGFPRIGRHRELKRAVESSWAGRTDAESLHAVSRDLRLTHGELQRPAGIRAIPSNDFSWYDHVLDTNCHYIVPEFSAEAEFRVMSRKPVDEFLARSSRSRHLDPGRRADRRGADHRRVRSPAPGRC